MKKFSFILLITFLLISGCASGEKRGTPINDFNFTNQDGEPFGLKDLEGKVWLAAFVYTYCPKECPMMTLHMSDLQDELKDAGLDDVQLVSFSIDPETDTPDLLKKYGESFGADFNTWNFLTGYTQEEIEEYGPKNFKTVIKKPQNEDYVIHMVDAYLLNKHGEIISQYNMYEDVPFKQIIKDVKAAVK